MAITFSSVLVTPLPGGRVMVDGLATCGADYVSTGEVADLSTYIKAGSTNATFRMIPSPGDDGYVPQHSRGTSNAGVIFMYEAGADAAALDMVADNTNLAAVVFPFVAIGPAY